MLIPRSARISAAPRISASVKPFRTTRRMRSEPASGASVMVFCPLARTKSASSGVRESTRREDKEIGF